MLKITRIIEQCEFEEQDEEQDSDKEVSTHFKKVLPNHDYGKMLQVWNVWLIAVDGSLCKIDDWFSFANLSWVVQSDPVLDGFGNERCCAFYKQLVGNVVTCSNFYILVGNVCIWEGF